MTLAGMLVSGAGNRFILLDAREQARIASAAQRARDFCSAARAEWGGGRADGLLLLYPPGAEGDVRLVIYNADGTRPEACGNGLRCVGSFLADQAPSRTTFRVETDAGARLVRLAGGVVWVGLGRPRTRRATAELAGARREATLVDIGNPHCVLFVDELTEVPLERWGQALQDHPLFSDGVNVEVVVPPGAQALGTPSVARARVFERGVGETRACGTGAVAVALACEERFGMALPARVRLPGGELSVERDDAGELWLAGPLAVDGPCVLVAPPATRADV